MFGNRGIYHKGWTAVTKHKTPWILVGEETPAFDDDRWELYDTTKDWSQTHDLSNDQPDKLHELQRLWLIEATRYNVLPLDDRVAERLTPDLAGRSSLIKGNSQLLFGGIGAAVGELGHLHQGRPRGRWPAAAVLGRQRHGGRWSAGLTHQARHNGSLHPSAVSG